MHGGHQEGQLDSGKVLAISEGQDLGPRLGVQCPLHVSDLGTQLGTSR